METTILIGKVDARIMSGLMRETEAAKEIIQESDEAVKMILMPLIPDGSALEDYTLQNTPSGLALVKVKKE